MMKRVCLVILILLMIVPTAVSCGSDGSEAYKLYTAARELYMKGYEASVSISVDGAGGSIDIKTAGDSVSAVRSSSGHSRYFVDGMLYRSGYLIDGSVVDGKVKLTSSKDAFIHEHLEFFGANPYASYFPALTEEDLRDVELKPLSPSGRAFTVNLAAQHITTYLCLHEEISSAEGTMTVNFNDNGDMSLMVLKMNVTYPDGEKISYEFRYTFYNIGLVPMVLPPEDPNGEYIEL